MKTHRMATTAALGIACLLTFGMASSANATPFAYIPNLGDGTMSVIDIATNTVVATVTLGAPATAPFHNGAIAVDPAGAFVFVDDDAPAFTGSLEYTDVIDTSNNSIVSQIPDPSWPNSPPGTAGGPSGIAINPAGTTLYYLNGAVGTISGIDTATYTVDHLFQGNSIQASAGLAVHPAGRLLYIASFGFNDVQVFDTTTNSVTATIPLPSRPSVGQPIAMDPAGKFAYVLLASPLALGIIDVTSNQLLGTVTLTGVDGGIAVSPDGTTIYAAVGQPDLNNQRTPGTLYAIDARTYAIRAAVPVGKTPQAVGVSPDGRSIYVPNSWDNTVTVLDAATLNTIATIPVGMGPKPYGLFIGPTQTPAQMIAALIAEVTQLQFQQAINLLTNAERQAVSGHAAAACNQINAFSNQVAAQSGAQLTTAEAADITNRADIIEAALGCTVGLKTATN